MVEDGKGGGAFAEVTLRPHVTVADASMVDAATAAHAQANAWCFIANSVNFPVRHEPTIEVAPERREPPRSLSLRALEALVRQDLPDPLDGAVRGRLVELVRQLLPGQRVDRRHDVVGGQAARPAGGGGAVVAQFERFAEAAP